MLYEVITLFGDVFGQILAQQFQLAARPLMQLAQAAAQAVGQHVTRVVGQLLLPVDLQPAKQHGHGVDETGIAADVQLLLADVAGQLAGILEQRQGCQGSYNFV